jgi:hypothetical protein
VPGKARRRGRNDDGARARRRNAARRDKTRRSE